MQDIEPVAYEIGLKPWDLWRLTPVELTGLIDAANRRVDREWYRTAWLAMHVYRACFISAGGKKGSRAVRKITPESLLGKPKKKTPSAERDDGEPDPVTTTPKRTRTTRSRA